MIVGLTGGIGSGKTMVSDHFAKLGVDIIDADEVAREVVEPGSEGLKQLLEHFGTDILLADGRLDRRALRQRVFDNSQEKEWLDQCLHPLIRHTMRAQIKAAQSPYVIVVVPLLAENQQDYQFDSVIVVDTDEKNQIARASQRDQMSNQNIQAIIQHQATREQRLQLADHVLNNNGSLKALLNQVEQLHAHFTSQLKD